MSEKTELLRKVDLFSLLDEGQLQVIAKRTVEKTYAKGDLIIMEEDVGNQSFFILAEGQVKVYITSVEGREAILALLGEGDFFGEMSLLDGENRSASVQALEKTRLFTISREDFLGTLAENSELTLTLLGELSRRLRKSNRQVFSLSQMRVYGRIAASLLQLMEQKGIRTRTQDGQRMVVIHDRPKQQEIAEMAGTTRETVSRVLQTLQKKGYIALSGRDLFILQEDELKP